MSEMTERVKAAIAEKFAPAIDFKAPYAKVMLDMAAEAVIATIEASGHAIVLEDELLRLQQVEAMYEDAASAAEDRRFC
jgi:hypothetical protein